MTEPKARHLVGSSRDGKASSHYDVGSGRMTPESLVWLFENVTGRLATPEELELCRRRLAKAYRKLNAEKMIETKRRRQQPVLSEAEIALALIEEHDQQTNLPGAIAVTTIVLTDRFDRALQYATHVHGGQTRKGSTIPYVAHLLAVAGTVLEYGGSEDMAIAGLLHDAVEDQGGEPRLQDIRSRFGGQVADIVRACSDSVVNTSAGGKKEEWLTRKTRYVDHLRSVDENTLWVSLADKVHNARSILRDLQRDGVGQAVWQRFTTGREGTLWYYGALAEVFMDRLPGQQLPLELADIVAKLGGGEKLSSMSASRKQAKHDAEPQRTPEELEFIADMERLEGRKFSEQEINLYIHQAQSIGEL